MKWVLYLISPVSLGLSIYTFAESVSDIQIIIGIQFVTLAILSFGQARILSQVGRVHTNSQQDPNA